MIFAHSLYCDGKKISRTAAGDLGVSRALLGYYRNGLMTGLSRCRRRTTACPAIICSGARWRATARHLLTTHGYFRRLQTGKSQILNAAALLLRLCRRAGSEQLPHEIEVSLHRDLRSRYLYLADPGSIEAVFPPRTTALIIFATARLPRTRAPYPHRRAR
ncbi:MAG: hypothetical protein ACLR4Z_02215 [Butyricicoccaceae bacterium]